MDHAPLCFQLRLQHLHLAHVGLESAEEGRFGFLEVLIQMNRLLLFIASNGPCLLLWSMTPSAVTTDWQVRANIVAWIPSFTIRLDHSMQTRKKGLYVSMGVGRHVSVSHSGMAARCLEVSWGIVQRGGGKASWL